MRRPSFRRAGRALDALADEGARVSVAVVDIASGESLLAVDEHLVLPTASVGKILLLIEVSARLTERSLSAIAPAERTARDAVADSGIWQHLRVPALPVVDLAALVGATSDNLATNVLLRLVGIDAVRARSQRLGLVRTALLDQVRDVRGPGDAPHLSGATRSRTTVSSTAPGWSTRPAPMWACAARWESSGGRARRSPMR